MGNTCMTKDSPRKLGDKDKAKNELEEVRMQRLIMLGDSTLDNIAWVEDYSQCIKGILESDLKGFQIINYAADGYTSNDMLNGAYPYISYSRREKVDPYPTNIKQLFNPLDQMEKLDTQPQYAVLSIGGNDVREILHRMQKLESRLQQFKKNYPQIVDRIRQNNKDIKLIIMLQYKPSIKQQNYKVYQAMDMIPGRGDSKKKLNTLFEKIYNDQGIFQMAQKYNIPIIDMTNTFDIYNTNFYVSQIEPSHIGGKIISKLISHIVKYHDFEGSSKLYSMPRGNIKIVDNDFNEEKKWKTS